MTDKTMNRLAFAGLVIIALVMYGMTLHMDYVEARTGINCETHVRSCE
jgi:hypothetical protein